MLINKTEINWKQCRNYIHLLHDWPLLNHCISFLDLLSLHYIILYHWNITQMGLNDRINTNVEKHKQQALLTLMSLVSVIMQPKCTFNNNATAYMHRWKDIITAMCNKSYYQWSFQPFHWSVHAQRVWMDAWSQWCDLRGECGWRSFLICSWKANVNVAHFHF